MRRLIRTVITIVVAVLVAAVAALPAQAQQPASCPPPGKTWNGNNPWCYDWQGTWDEQSVQVASADGPLAGTVFAPTAIAAGVRVPAIAILHGLGGKQYSMWWLGRYLAGHGYVAVTVTTAGNNAANVLTAMQSMVDFLRSPDNPYAGVTDTGRIGAAGHSAGARATSWVQDNDFRQNPSGHVQAVVALDNLTSDQNGDAGTYLLAPQCTTGLYTSGLKSLPITPRVPALGLASDDNAVTCPERNVMPDPEAKKAGWSKWRAAGLSSMELVLRGANHLSFDQDFSRTFTGEAYLQLTGELTQAWFDTYLGGDRSGLDRLLGADLFGAPRGEQLSTQFHSAAYVPDLGIDCARFELVGCPP
jgi:hypothetical protein